jgi:hypothetical protein
MREPPVTVRLTQIDGKLPNLALMKIARFHRDRGDEIVFSKHVERGMFEPDYSAVYGSAIFAQSADRVAAFKASFPDAIVGGTWNMADTTTVEARLGLGEQERFDYTIYPGFTGSIGFTQRGCRLKCGFCVVPQKEGKPRSVSTVYDIWRGEPYPKHLHLLDNDFFGQPREQWEARIDEIKSVGFKVCLNQGINIRMIDGDAAKALASIPVRDDQFKTRRLYTAWDNLGDECRFFAGVDLLEDQGLPPTCLMVYMLVGYDKKETWERVYRDLWKYDSVYTFTCAPNDTHNCILNAYVRNGVVVRVGPSMKYGEATDLLGNKASSRWDPRVRFDGRQCHA